ncbi:MAG: PIG-L deacetylase family protein [Candidatus Methylomirabilia bacterium]
MSAAAAAKRVLVITAHPDDVDVHAGGTVCRWADEGHEVHYVACTSGDKGHSDPAITRDQVIALRRAEQEAAARILGVKTVRFLGYEDGTLAWAGRELTEEVTRLIRAQRPAIVLTHDPFTGPPRYVPYQLHPDHRAVGSAVVDAVHFRAPGHLYYPEHSAEGLKPHRVGELFLLMGDHADYFVDISSTFERKLAAVRAHASQWGTRPDLEGFLRQRAERVGSASGPAKAEAFKRLVPE